MSSCRKHLVRKHLQRIITCSCLITAAFMKEKQDISRNIFSASVEKCRGYLLWFVKHPKPLKHITYEKESERIIMPIPNKATEQAHFLLPLQNHFILRLHPTLLSVTLTTERRHRDIADSRTRLLIFLSYLGDFCGTTTNKSFFFAFL